MAETAVQTTLPPVAASPAALNPEAPPPASLRKPGPRGPLLVAWKILSVLASLRLTVVLLAMAMVIVFCGTLAQVDQSIWAVVANYFRSFYVWIPFQIFLPRTWNGQPTDIRGGFPFPGGWLIGTCLLVNLLAAHLVRFKLSWKRSGVLLIHAGLIVMMLGELTTGLFAVEGMMSIRQGSSSNYVEHPTAPELAVIEHIVDHSGLKDKDMDDVVVVPASLLRKQPRISSNDLPFDIETVHYWPNSMIYDRKPGPECPEDIRDKGKELSVEERREAAGVSTDSKHDLPSAYVTFKDKNTGQSLGTYLVSILVDPQPVTVGDRTYEVALRFSRTYKPYRLKLLEGGTEYYQGTKLAHRHSSKVLLTDETTGENREVLISMNDPFRYRGDAIYQESMTPPEAGRPITGLQVVNNPGWTLPYISCAVVVLGMVIHFTMHLVGFLKKRAAL
jgi:hypothetical protein